MSRFAGVLKKVSDGLDLPQPTRSRILLEMAGDLEDLYEYHRGEGLDEDQAARRAEEAFAASDEALKHLARIHEANGGFTDRFARQAGSWWEKALLVIWLLAVILVAKAVVTEVHFFVIISPFVWPIVGLAVAALLFTLWKLYALLFKKPPELRRLRSGLGVLLFLAAASLVVSLCGFFYHLRWYAFQTWEKAPETVFMMFANWTLAISSMMIIGLLTAIFTALAWFLLANLVARIENREADALLADA
jgi:hypothetical protein